MSPQNPDHPSYDRDRSAPITRPDLRKLEGVGSSPQHPDHRPAGAVGSRKSVKPSLLKQQEQRAGDTAVSVGQLMGLRGAPELAAAVPGLSQISKLKHTLWGTDKNRKRTLFGGGGIAVVVVLAAVLMTFLPNELVSLMTGLENHFFAAVEHDLKKEGDKLVSRYVKKRILGRLGSACKDSAEVEKCVKDDRPGGSDAAPADDPIEGKGGLFDKWDDSDLARKLATRGITFSKTGDRYFVNADALPGGTLDVTDALGSEDTDLFEYIDGKVPSFSATLSDAVEASVATKGSFLHDIFTRALTNRFGTRWCVMDCDPGSEESNRADLSTADKQNFADAVEEERVIEPAATVEGDAVKCLMDTGCDPSDRHPGGGSADTDVSAGERTSQFDTSEAQDLGNLASKFGSRKVSALVDTFNALKGKAADGMATAVAKLLSGALGKEVATESVSDVMGKLASAFNAASWAQLALSVFNFIADANNKLKALNYAILSARFAPMFTSYVSAMDEQKSGQNHPDAAELGSLVSALHQPDAQGNASNALASPFVRKSIDPNNSSNLSSSQIHSYLASGHFALNGYKNTLTAASNALQSIPGFDLIHTLTSVAQKILDGLLAPISKLIGMTVGDLIGKVTMPLMQWLMKEAFPQPPIALSGEQRGTAIAVGADISGNIAARSVGGQALSPEQSAQLTAEAQDEQRVAFQRQPLFARLFGVDTPYSLVSRLAVALPGSAKSIGQSALTALLRSPISTIFGSLSSVLRPDDVFAAPAPELDPAGVTQYGIPDSDPVFASDPETYWQTHDCANQAKQGYPDWNSDSNTYVDDDTAQTEHRTTNGCLLIQRAAEASGALAGFQD